MLSLRPQQEHFLTLTESHSKMLTVAPTSAGKSIMMIAHAMKYFNENQNSKILVVAPKIVLVQQLSLEFQNYIEDVNYVHVHSGETSHKRIKDFLELSYWDEKTEGSKLFFTTYHSLSKICQSEICFDVVYFDECHHAVNSRFVDSVKTISQVSSCVYSLTATPRFSETEERVGNNNQEIFGSYVYNVSAVDLVKNGSILPPKSTFTQIDGVRNSKENPAERDFYTLCDTILNEEDMDKVLVVAPSTKVLFAMLSMTSFMEEMQQNGYEILHITSKYGAFVGNRKVTRTEFLKTLNDYGSDDTKKFIVLHIGILTEGVSVPGIQSCIFLRDQNYVSTIQTIGRCIRVHAKDTIRIQNGELIPGDFESYYKPHGRIVVPVYSNKVGAATAKKVDHVIDKVFVEGDYVVDLIK